MSLFRRRSFWIILLLTAIVWLVVTMSEHNDYPVQVRVQWTGFDSTRHVVTYADSVLPLTINSNCFLAQSRYIVVKQKPFVINVSGDTVLSVNNHLFQEIIDQMDFGGTHGISSPVETLKLKLTDVNRKGFVPQLRDVEFRFKDQIGLAGEPRVEPDTVWLYGNIASLNKIDQLETKSCKVNNIAKSGYYSLPLNPVWKQYGDVKSSHDSVRIYVPAGRFIEKTFVVPLSFNTKESVRWRLMTEQVSVTLWVPDSAYNDVTEEMIGAEVIYRSSDVSQELPVRIIKFPENTRVKQVSPASVQYVIIK